MMKPDIQSENVDNPRQYSLLDLLGLLTIASLLISMFAPYLRQLTAENQTRLLVAFLVQAALVTFSLTTTMKKRKSVTSEAGNRLGIGYAGQVRWKHWPVAKSAFQLFCLSCFQLLAGIAIAISDKWNFTNFIVFQLQLGPVTGVCLARYLWRVYPGAIEFFEHGIVQQAFAFSPWTRVEIRPSSFFSDRNVLFVRQAEGSNVGGTLTVQMSESLKQAAQACATMSTELAESDLVQQPRAKQ